jgi:nudix-type nucleoside diphosphatase (YffH/AdpP family)
MTTSGEFRILDSETVYEGWSRMRRVTIAPTAGPPFRREIEDHGSAACVLPYDPERRTALLIRLPRAPMIEAGAGLSTEAIAGLLDDDSPEVCAQREAMEEAGVRLERLEPIGAFWVMPGVSTERLHLFLAPYSAVDRIGPGGGLASESEHIEVIETRLVDLAAQADRGALVDLKTSLLVATLRLKRPDLFQD